MENMSGMENISSIGGELRIAYNPALININSLESLNSIGGDLTIYSNDTINSLTGLENIDAGTISGLNINHNSSLSTCEVQSICDYLANPNGTIEIYDNAPGCNSVEEVEEACETVSIDEVSFNGNIITSPNPFTTSTTLSYELQQPEKVFFSIYNQMGQLVYQTQENQPQGKQHLIWNAERYADGIYYYRLQAGEQAANGKIVKVR